MSLPKDNALPWHFYYILNTFEYLYEKYKLYSSSRIKCCRKIIKDLRGEVKFIHENKFRQILKYIL